jgi:REP element-mobilizing transposase RayT
MNEYESLNHTKWEFKYHVVFIPKYRRKALYGSPRKPLVCLGTIVGYRGRRYVRAVRASVCTSRDFGRFR